jgi:hypothetical protein
VAAIQDQNDEKEITRLANKERNGLVIVLLIVTAILKVLDWIRGGSLFPDKLEIAFFIVSIFIVWLVAPIIFEFRIRSRRIDGKLNDLLSQVQKIEKQLNL